MWPFEKKELRRAGARRAKAQAHPSFFERMVVPGGLTTLLLGMAFAVVAVVILLFGEFSGGQAGLSEPWRGLYRAAVAVSVVFLAGAIGVYLAHYCPRALSNHTRTTAVAALILLALAVGRVFSLLDLPIMLLLIPGLVVPIIITITYNQRIGLGIGGFFAMLLMLSTTRWQLEELKLAGLFSVFFVLITCITFTVFLLKEIRSRSKIIEVGIVTGLAGGLAVWATALVSRYSELAAEPSTTAKEILYDSLWAILAAIIVGLVIQVILPLVEKVFRVATSMTLLEWCDANRPLLKRLALEAPGTYNHSLQVGTIAEMAAEAVGANGLLCRVGAYYHDVGKLQKTGYFVENQAGQPSKHGKLSPAMSALVILGHVKDGLAIAKEYSLPRVLHQFIEQHHGTALVEYFYHEAQKREPEKVIPDTEFRHVGPKPQSPEAGIVMLTDTAESAVRSLSEPTGSRIELTVHNLLMKRLMDGQFDECELTLRQLHIVEESLVKALCGMYHARVAYPESGQGKNGKTAQQKKKSAKPEAPKPAGPVQEAAAAQQGSRQGGPLPESGANN